MGSLYKIDSLALRRAMANKALGVNALAEKARVSTATVTRFTRGRATNAKTLGKIAGALDVMPEMLVDFSAKN